MTIKTLVSLLEFADALLTELKATPAPVPPAVDLAREAAVNRIKLLLDDASVELEAIRSSDIGDIGNVEGQ